MWRSVNTRLGTSCRGFPGTAIRGRGAPRLLWGGKFISIRINWGDNGMPEASGGRLTVSVGKREFENLYGAWAAYTDATQARGGTIDPVLAMQRTGIILQSLKAIIATLDVESEKPGEDPNIIQ